MPALAFELLLSDSGRNLEWSAQIQPGDSFRVAGATRKPVGGVFNLSSSLGQFLLPMPHDDYLSSLDQAGEAKLVKEWGDLICDHVQIAVMNREPCFEIRLLQNTPAPKNPVESWDGNLNAGKFARIAYASLAKSIVYLKERDVPVAITAAMADTGAEAFARVPDAWKGYANIFHRVDLVQGHAGLKETGEMISLLGPQKIRIFINTAAKPTPIMTVGRREIAEALLARSPGLMVYYVHPEIVDTSEPDHGRPAADWMDILSGWTPLTIEHLAGTNSATSVSAEASPDRRPPSDLK